ncbi:MAG: ATP synthase F1 subunit epsilon [Acidimicrobiia bacterium]
MSAESLDVVVVSPARALFEGTAHWVTAPAVNGQLGILPRHAPIVAALGSGPLRIGGDAGTVLRFAVRGGFLQVSEDKVTILVDNAVTEVDAEAAEAQRELDETVGALRSPKSDEEFAELLDRRAWNEARLKLARPPS